MTVSADEFRKLALALEGAEERPHFDRAAFRVKRNFATLAPGGRSANLKLLPDEQELRCAMSPAFSPVPNKWGQQGWTTVDLDAVSADELAGALETAWRHALPGRRR